ncbi:hypothetical protein F4009_12680 [Candidatus Poribacteria bacterium]|uniref:Uncharacterized protein n=1 Tax=Caldilineaceae bacterium SB0675_bin_29 TaxID=2605266 RepID=A0A6B1G4P7_9CHLR|nr:hypothetical protein [Caldilineaceae bacterium SB0675_bin_29]MYK94829.1 hypothetical protein [Candidatus Poribacteria bacterium]
MSGEHENGFSSGKQRLEIWVGLHLRYQYRRLHAFHGGFPLRFEGRQFEYLDREDVNGVRYLRELLAAGEAGGGYVEYMFDNPAIESDEEFGSRKIAYATGFLLPVTCPRCLYHRSRPNRKPEQ